VLQNETIERVLLGLARLADWRISWCVCLFRIERGISEQNEHAEGASPERNTLFFKMPVQLCRLHADCSSSSLSGIVTFVRPAR
jgi:hypothetical protein